MNDHDIDRCCCFTGHRSLPYHRRPAIRQRLRTVLIQLIEQGVWCFGAGGALGFDTLAAQTVLELKEQYPQIRLVLVLPCKEQTRGWSAANTAEYSRILQQADKVVWLSERYYRGCMHVRNRRLVDSAQTCVCYYTGGEGGTAYTVGYAREKGRRILNLAEQ